MVRTRVRRALATAGLLATLGAAMAMFAPAASASPYCGGWLGGGAQCNGAERSLAGVSGYGEQHAVCVWADNLGQACTGGPGGLASINYGWYSIRTPKIRNQAASANFVHGETF